VDGKRNGLCAYPDEERIYSYSYASETDTSYGCSGYVSGRWLQSETDTAEFLVAQSFMRQIWNRDGLGPVTRRVKLRAIAYATSVILLKLRLSVLLDRPLDSTSRSALPSAPHSLLFRLEQQQKRIQRSTFKNEVPSRWSCNWNEYSSCSGTGRRSAGFYFPLRYLVGVSGAGQYLLTGLTVESILHSLCRLFAIRLG